MRFIGRFLGALALVAAGSLGVQSKAAPLDDPSAPAVPSERGVPQASAPALEGVEVEAWLDGLLPYILEKGRVAGAVVVVVQAGRPVVEKGYGFADVSTRAPVDPKTTMFRPGSVSKLFTWTAVMQLVEEGELDLDEDVNQYLDFEIPPYKGQPVTLRHILTHTAGFEETVRHLMSNAPGEVMSLQDYVKLSLPPRVFAPGTTPAYSNYATALAGYIVERVSGQSFDEYMDRHIFEPLGMRHSTFRQPLPSPLEGYMSKGYTSSTEDPRPFEQVFGAPAGGLSSSGSDMGKFMLAHLAKGGPILKPDTVSLMHNYRAPGVQSLNKMALGFYEQWINGHRAIGHGGDTPLFHSYLWLFPQADIGLYVSVNSAGTDDASSLVRTALFQGFADRYLPQTKDFASIDEETARKHAELMAGHYINSRGSFTNFLSVIGMLSPVEVSADADGRLLVPSFDDLSVGERDWIEVEPFVWRDRRTGERLAADVEDGRVVRFSVDSVSPFMVFLPAPTSVDAGWQIPAVLAALGLVFLAAIAWPVRAIVRRKYGAELGLSDSSLLAYRLSRICAWLIIVVLAGWAALMVAIFGDFSNLGGPFDWLINSLRLLTPIASLGLLLSSGWHLWLCFKGQCGWPMKVSAALLTFSGLIFSWITIVYHLYGFGMTY